MKEVALNTVGMTSSGYQSQMPGFLGFVDSGLQSAVDSDIPFLSWIGKLFGYDKMSDHDIYNGASTEELYENNSLLEYLQGLMASQGQEAIESRLYNSIEAQKNRDWQEYMSNTSYQRAVADLQKAGLNPILAAKVSGASTPSGYAASHSSSGDTLSDLLKAFAALISSATGVGRLEALLNYGVK